MVEKTGQRFSINLISAISPEGELRWMEVEGRMNAERFIDFLRALIRGRKKPVYLIVDGHSAHTAKAVREFVENNRRRLKLFVLPSYSPQLNPDELVWNHLKNHTIGKSAFHVVRQLRAMIREHLDWLAGQRALLRSFFDEPQVRYAKA